jgi:UDP-2,4-diacetamido-2,4,6-trideoxy-beta-L-altropyranose hydrolase
MRVAFRVDASPEIGGGHVMRCLTLARALVAERQAECAFLSAAGTGETVPALVRAGLPIFDVDGLSAEPPAEFRAHWPDGVDCVIVDHYGIESEVECHFRTWAKSVVVIDDLANRRHDCDLLIDQTFGRTADAYRQWVPENCLVLTGSAYALVRPEFAAARPMALARRAAGGPVRRILVSLGLTDLGGITGRVLRAVLALKLPCAIDVVLGGRAASLAEVQALARDHPEVTVHIDLDTAEMVQLMVDVDMAIGAGGTSTWERCCLGLPCIVLVLAENQFETAGRLTKAGASVAIVMVESLSAYALASAVEKLAASATDRARMAKSAAAVCDGEGGGRVVRMLVKAVARSLMGHEQLSLRPAQVDDCELLYRWRNDPQTQAMSIATVDVLWDDHIKWFEDSLRSPSRLLLVGEKEGRRVGVVRFDIRDKAAEVSVTVAPDVRRAGVGRAMLAKGCHALLVSGRVEHITARIKKQNTLSLRAFASVGFSPLCEADNILVYKLEATAVRDERQTDESHHTKFGVDPLVV